MIKCPKCQFEQPDDIYCAQCGVNMKTFVPPKPSILQLFLANQVLQIGLLFVGIVAFVIYDFSKEQSKPRTDVSDVAREISRPVPTNDPPPPPPTEINRASSIPPEPPAARNRRVKAAKPYIENTSDTENATVAASPAATNSAIPPQPLATSLVVSFYQASRNLINEIQREATSTVVSGEAYGGVLTKKKLNALKKSGELRSLSSNRYKLDGLPITVFKGQRSAESAKSVGIYMQMTTLKNEPGSLQMEMKGWGHVKIQEPDENLFTSEMTLTPQHVTYISGFLPRDKTFNDEEKALFDTDRALKIYNQEDFWDGQTDLILFLEIPE